MRNGQINKTGHSQALIGKLKVHIKQEKGRTKERDS